MAVAGSACLLIAAFGFQYLADLAPCTLCIWQRWPHVAAIIIGAIVILSGDSRFCWLGAASVLSGAAIALYHAGIEQQWWAEVFSCTGSPLESLSGTDLLDFSAPISKPCGEIAWKAFGLSMAAWNFLISVGLTAIWVRCAMMPSGFQSKNPRI